MEGMSAIRLDEAQAILESHDLIAIGARADEERRRRHGTRTTFVRVFEVHADAVPDAVPPSIEAGEIRITGQPRSVEDAVAVVTRALGLAGSIPLTAFSVVDLWDLAQGSTAAFRDLLSGLRAAGLRTIADAPVDALTDAVSTIGIVRQAGLEVPRLTVRQLAGDRRVDSVTRARDIQAALGGVRTLAPLPRQSSITQPSTGYDDVKQVAIARLLLDNIESIQVDWPLYGPKLAQVALTMGADDVDGVSALEGNLGRRRSPIEEIRGNIRAAGLEPVERDGGFSVR
jgi:aminodeoxyfutalosine synthase